MRRVLPNVSASHDEICKMLAHKDDSGAESHIVCLEEKGVPIVRKIFRNSGDYGIGDLDISDWEDIRENKFAKLVELYNIESFQNEVKILNTVSCDGRFIGYDMTHDKTSIPFERWHFTRKEKIFYLKQIEEQLKYFHSEGIVFGDIIGSNILYHPLKQTVSFCDLDNMQVKDYPIDLYNFLIVFFQDVHGLISPKIDAFVFNYFLLSQLDPHYDDYHELESQIEGGYLPSYLTPTGKKVITNMKEATLTDIYDGTYLTPYVKRK